MGVEWMSAGRSRLRARGAGGFGVAGALLRGMRPLQWTKNAVVFAALVFGMRLFDAAAFGAALGAALAFCAVSSAVYLINDAFDVEQDRLHPEKRFRPLAAGELGVGQAIAAAVLLLITSVLGSWWIAPPLLVVTVAYAFLMIAYTLVLKRVAVLDVLVIALGFVLRAVAGAVAIGVSISPWILVCTLLLALFLGLAKRRHELRSLVAPETHRWVLRSYSLPFLDWMLAICGVATVGAYLLYTIEARGVNGQPAMLLTAPLVAFAIGRYGMIVIWGQGGGSPERALWSDRPLLVTVALWGAACVAILYSGPLL